MREAGLSVSRPEEDRGEGRQAGGVGDELSVQGVRAQVEGNDVCGVGEMMSKEIIYGGKTLDEWIAQVETGNGTQCNRAIHCLQEMLCYGYVSNQQGAYRIAKAMGRATHSQRESTRVVAYGTLGITVRYFSFNLLKGTDREKTMAAGALRFMIQDSQNLHADLVKIAPDIVKQMRTLAVPNEEGIAAIVKKLEAEENAMRGKSRDAVKDALAKIAAP
jgi:hypothetical protein